MAKQANKRALRLICGIFYFCIVSTAIQADQQDEYQQSIDRIGEQISKLTNNLNTSKALLKNEYDRLSIIEQQIALLRKNVTSTERQISIQQQTGEELQLRISRLEDSRAKDKQAMANLIRERYKRGRPNYIKMLLNQENPYAVGRLSNYYEYFAKAQTRKLNDIRAQISASDDLYTKQQQGFTALKQQQRQYAKQQKQLAEVKRQRRDSITKLNRKVVQSSDKLKQLQDDRSRLDTLLKQLARQKQALERIERQRIQEQNRQQAKGRRTTNTKILRPMVKGGFLKQRGRLEYPVSAPPKYGFGNRLAESGMRAQGIFFETNIAIPVKSIFRGRVLFADYLKGYGLLLIVDHGDDHISLYGHNEVLYKKVGDRIESNEIIARSGVSGGLKSPGLYFEIRNNATPVDPAKWCQ